MYKRQNNRRDELMIEIKYFIHLWWTLWRMRRCWSHLIITCSTVGVFLKAVTFWNKIPHTVTPEPQYLQYMYNICTHPHTVTKPPLTMKESMNYHSTQCTHNTHVHACTYNTQVCTCTYTMNTYMHVHIIHMYIHAHTIYMYMHVHMYTCTYTHLGMVHQQKTCNIHQHTLHNEDQLLHSIIDTQQWSQYIQWNNISISYVPSTRDVQLIQSHFQPITKGVSVWKGHN